MSREDIQKLLGGYATGTLTPAEREALFSAALEDQELFDALAREESLRELLQDPVAKSRLAAALQTVQVPWRQRWLRPALLATGAAAIAVVAVVAFRNPRQPQPVNIAQVAPPPQEARSASAPSAVQPPPVPQPAAPEPKLQALKKVAPPAPKSADAAAPASPPATRQSPNDQTAVVDALAAPPPPAPAAAPPPPPATPRLAAPRAPVIALREPLAQAFAIRTSAPVQDARALFYGAALQLPLQTNLIRAEAEAKTRAITQAGNAPGVSSSAPHLGLRYTLLRVSPAAPEELNPAQELAAVENLQLSFQPNDGGYVYIFERDAAGQWTLRDSEPVARMAPYLLPRTGSLAFPPAGNLELFILFSRDPINPEDRQLTPRDDQAITVVPADRAAYVVSTSGNLPAQRLAFPLTLRRR